MKDYCRNGKSAKYFRLKSDFQSKYTDASKKFLRKNIYSLKEANPGKAFSILKKMGARPGDLEDTSNFLLPHHEGLSKVESGNKIADHFSQVSAEYLPLSVEKLPPRVLEKIKKKS